MSDLRWMTLPAKETTTRLDKLERLRQENSQHILAWFTTFYVNQTKDKAHGRLETLSEEQMCFTSKGLNT